MRWTRLVRVLVVAAALLLHTTVFAVAGSPVLGPEADDPGSGGGQAVLWTQTIEQASGTQNRTYASSYYQSQTQCDNDPDWDYIFVYNLNYQQNPDSLRYYSFDPAILVRLGAIEVKGFAFTWNECRLCVGDQTVFWIGGPDAFKAKVWLHQVY
ncbi:MAG: hypothetical protein K6V36_11175 [Anaerolineae bacterium]|nr:hypothetical protein [Anaerolineae bacterium]